MFGETLPCGPGKTPKLRHQVAYSIGYHHLQNDGYFGASGIRLLAALPLQNVHHLQSVTVFQTNPDHVGSILKAIQIATSNLTANLSLIQNIQDCTRYPIGTNEVTESLRHNENLFELPLEHTHPTIPIAVALNK